MPRTRMGWRGIGGSPSLPLVRVQHGGSQCAREQRNDRPSSAPLLWREHGGPFARVRPGKTPTPHSVHGFNMNEVIAKRLGLYGEPG
jgi:hypothetical protein